MERMQGRHQYRPPYGPPVANVNNGLNFGGYGPPPAHRGDVTPGMYFVRDSNRRVAPLYYYDYAMAAPMHVQSYGPSGVVDTASMPYYFIGGDGMMDYVIPGPNGSPGSPNDSPQYYVPNGYAHNQGWRG